MDAKRLPENEAERPVSEEYRVRCEKVQKLRARGIEPWPAVRPVAATIAEALAQGEAAHTAELSIAGRVMALRRHGKSIFARVQDVTGNILFELGDLRISGWC